MQTAYPNLDEPIKIWMGGHHGPIRIWMCQNLHLPFRAMLLIWKAGDVRNLIRFQTSTAATEP